MGCQLASSASYFSSSCLRKVATRSLNTSAAIWVVSAPAVLGHSESMVTSKWWVLDLSPDRKVEGMEEVDIGESGLSQPR